MCYLLLTVLHYRLSHWGSPGAGLVCLSSLGFLASMTAFFSVIPPESPSWAYMWVSCLAQISALPRGGLLLFMVYIHTLMYISTHRGLWNYVMYCFYTPKCTSPKWGLRKGMQTQGLHIFFPRKIMKCPTDMAGRQGVKTQDVSCGPLFSVEGRQENGRDKRSNRVMAGNHQEKVKEEQVKSGWWQSAFSNGCEKWCSSFCCHLPRVLGTEGGSNM